MPAAVQCPACRGPVERMPVLSEIGLVDYYRCGACRRIYMAAKGATSPMALPILPARTEQPSMRDAR